MPSDVLHQHSFQIDGNRCAYSSTLEGGDYDKKIRTAVVGSDAGAASLTPRTFCVASRIYARGGARQGDAALRRWCLNH